MKKIIAVLGVLVLVVGGWMLVKIGQKGAIINTVGEAVSPVSSTITEPRAVETDVSPSIVTNVKEFTVEGDNFSFVPKTITVNKGDTVKITFVNKVGFHDLVIDEFAGAKTKQLRAGESETITFVADKSGTFEYYCSVGSHRQQGMVGILTVN